MTKAEWNTLSFPKLGWEFPVYNTAFTIFGFEIKWYGIMIGIGMLLAIIYCYKRMKAVGIDSDRATDAIFGGFIGAILGARLYYVFMMWDSYKGDIKAIISIRDGGLAIYGGIIGALAVGLIVAKIRKVRVLPLLDLTGMGFLIGQAFGRWGNFFNHECFGRNTELPWGMTSPKIAASLAANASSISEFTGVTVDPSLPVHPCFFYESFWCLIGFIILHLYFRHRKFDGELFAMYICWYGAGRFFIEGLRTDSLMIGHLRVSQLVAAVSVIVALAVIIAVHSKIKADGKYILYKDTAESKEILATAERKNEEYKQKKLERKNVALKKEDKIIDDETEENENGTDN